MPGSLVFSFGLNLLLVILFPELGTQSFLGNGQELKGREPDTLGRVGCSGLRDTVPIAGLLYPTAGGLEDELRALLHNFSETQLFA